MILVTEWCEPNSRADVETLRGSVRKHVVRFQPNGQDGSGAARPIMVRVLRPGVQVRATAAYVP